MQKFATLVVSFLLFQFSAVSLSETMGGQHVWNFALVGGATIADPTGTSTLTNADYSPQMGFAFGFLANYYFSQHLSMETGLEYVAREYGSSTINYTTNGIELPLMLRFWPIQYFSIGVGGYLHQFIGGINETAVGSVGGSTLDYSAFNYNTLDYGVMGGAQIKIPVTNHFNFLLDGRFLYGLVDIDNRPVNGYYTRTFEFLGGLGFTF